MFERGALLLVPFPFTDLSASKRRLVLALTVPDAHGDFQALSVTSRPQTQNAIALSAADLIQGGLPLASWLRTDRIVTLNSSLVLKDFGQVSEGILEQALALLCLHMGHKPQTPT